MLDRVKPLATVPNHEFATTEQVAAFYEVDGNVIRNVVSSHRGEFRATGYVVKTSSELGKLKGKSGNLINPNAYRIGTFDRRAVLLLGMLLRDSEVAKTVRRYLFGAERAHKIVAASSGSLWWRHADRMRLDLVFRNCCPRSLDFAERVCYPGG